MEKPASEFSRSSYQRTGLRSWCKECSSKSKKQAKAEGRWKSYDLKAKVSIFCEGFPQLSQIIYAIWKTHHPFHLQ